MENYIWVRRNEFGGVIGRHFTDAEINEFPTRENAIDSFRNGWYVERIDDNTIQTGSILYPNAGYEMKRVKI